MKTSPPSEMVHSSGEGESLFPLGHLGRDGDGRAHSGGAHALRRTGRLEHVRSTLGYHRRLAERYPGQRTSPNAAPVREVLHSFMVTVLIEGRRFSHVGWVRDDPGVAAVLGLERVRGEDALPRLMRPLSAEQARTWLGRAESTFVSRAAGTIHCGLGRDGQHALRPAGRGRGGLQPLQAWSTQSSSPGLRGGGHAPVFTHGVAAWQSGQCHGLANGDGTAVGSRRDPVPPMAEPRGQRLRPGAGLRVA